MCIILLQSIISASFHHQLSPSYQYLLPTPTHTNCGFSPHYALLFSDLLLTTFALLLYTTPLHQTELVFLTSTLPTVDAVSL